MSILEGFTAITFKGELTFNSNKPRILSVALRYGENRVLSLPECSFIWSIMDDTSSLSGGQRGFLKILEFLMNNNVNQKAPDTSQICQRILFSRAVG